MIISSPLQESDDSPPANNPPYDTIIHIYIYIYIRLFRGSYEGKDYAGIVMGSTPPTPSSTRR